MRCSLPRAVARLAAAVVVFSLSTSHALADDSYAIPAPWSADCSAIDATRTSVVARVTSTSGDGVFMATLAGGSLVVPVDGTIKRVAVNVSGNLALLEGSSPTTGVFVTLMAFDGTKKWTKQDKRRFDFDSTGTALVAWSPDPNLESEPDQVSAEVFNLDGSSSWKRSWKPFVKWRPGVVALDGGSLVVVGHRSGLLAFTKTGLAWKYERGLHESLVHDIRLIRHDRIAVRHDYGTPKVIDGSGRLVANAAERALASTGLLVDWDTYEHVEPWGMDEKTRVLFQQPKAKEAFIYDTNSGNYDLLAIDADAPAGFTRCGKARQGGIVFVKPSEIRVRDLQP